MAINEVRLHIYIYIIDVRFGVRMIVKKCRLVLLEQSLEALLKGGTKPVIEAIVANKAKQVKLYSLPTPF